MDFPDVCCTTVKDPERNVTYRIMAYRQLQKHEIMEAIASYQAQPSVRRKKRKPRNQVITILTIYGATANL